MTAGSADAAGGAEGAGAAADGSKAAGTAAAWAFAVGVSLQLPQAEETEVLVAVGEVASSSARDELDGSGCTGAGGGGGGTRGVPPHCASEPDRRVCDHDWLDQALSADPQERPRR